MRTLGLRILQPRMPRESQLPSSQQAAPGLSAAFQKRYLLLCGPRATNAAPISAEAELFWRGGKLFGLNTGLDLCVCKPNSLGASLNQNSNSA